MRGSTVLLFTGVNANQDYSLVLVLPNACSHWCQCNQIFDYSLMLTEITDDGECDIDFDPSNQDQYIVWANGPLGDNGDAGETAFIHFTRSGGKYWGGGGGLASYVYPLQFTNLSMTSSFLMDKLPQAWKRPLCII